MICAKMIVSAVGLLFATATQAFAQNGTMTSGGMKHPGMTMTKIQLAMMAGASKRRIA